MFDKVNLLIRLIIVIRMVQEQSQQRKSRRYLVSVKLSAKKPSMTLSDKSMPMETDKSHLKNSPT